VLKCFAALRHWLLLPFQPVNAQFHAQEFVEQIKVATLAEGVSIFLLSDQDRNRLDLAAQVGYHEDYKDVHYFLNEPSLTSHVFTTRAYVTGSANELRDNADVRVSGRCANFLLSSEWRNTVAIPILFGNTPLGVLKIENKSGTTPADAFPEADLVLARILAQVIGVSCRQSHYSDLWNAAEQAQQQSRSMKTYADRVVDMVVRCIGSEAAAIYLRDPAQQSVLQYVAGKGHEHAYTMRQHNLLRDNSFVTHVANNWVSIRATADVLQRRNIPSPAAESALESGENFRNVIAFALLGDRGCFGVLEIVNKLPSNADEFDQLDVTVCKELIKQQIVPSMLRLVGTGVAADGVALLSRELSADPEFRSADQRTKAQMVQAVQQKQGTSIRVDDCVSFLNISRAYYYKLIGQRPKT
jgi:GAF domain-containing protein